MCRQREKSVGKSSPSSSSGKSSGKGGTSRINTDKCYCCEQLGHRRPDWPRRNESCSLCGKRGHFAQVLGLLRWNPPSLRRREKFNTCGHCQSVTFLDSRWTLCLFATPLISRSDESGNLLIMIMDSGAEELVVSLADWKSLGEPMLKPAQVRLRSATGDDMVVSGSFMVRGWCDNQMVELTALVSTRATRSLCSATKLVNAGYSIEMRPTQSVLGRSGGGCMLLQRYGKCDFPSIRVRKGREINAITFSTMKREVQSLKSE